MTVSVVGYCVYSVSQCVIYGYVNGGFISMATTSDANYLGWVPTYATINLIVPAGSYYVVAENYPGNTISVNWTEMN